MDQDPAPDDPAVAAVQRLSHVHEPIAVLRQQAEILIVVRVGMKATRRFMILNAEGEPAWPHEPLGSLSDVAWALQAHGWQLAPVAPVGGQPRPAKTLASLLNTRA